MPHWLKRTVLGLLALIALALLAALAAAQWGDRQRQRQVSVPAHDLALPSDAASLQRGAYLFASRGCAECHGADGAGRAFINDGKGMRVKSPNISPGAGSVVAAYTVQDWERVLRHGVKPNGRPLYVMPSEDYAALTDADTAALIAHARGLPPAAGGPAEYELPLPVRAMIGLGVIPDASQKIDQSRAHSAPVAEAVSVEHGRYVAQMCIGCHGPGLSGGKIPGGPPDWPAAANLTPGAGTAMPAYAQADAFVAMMRSGKRPDGSAVSPVMPFATTAALNDIDLRAIHAYLKSLPGQAAGGR